MMEMDICIVRTFSRVEECTEETRAVTAAVVGRWQAGEEEVTQKLLPMKA